MLYTLGYSLEDIGEVWQLPNGTPAAPSTISKVLKRGGKVLRGEVRVPPNQMPQSTISHLQRYGVFQNLVDLHDSKYATKKPKLQKTYKDHKTLTREERISLLRGRKLFELSQQGWSVERIASNANISEEVVVSLMNYYVAYMKG